MNAREQEGRIICVKCGKLVIWSEAEGSYQHPYCKKCFKEVWNDDYERYLAWLDFRDYKPLTLK